MGVWRLQEGQQTVRVISMYYRRVSKFVYLCLTSLQCVSLFILQQYIQSSHFHPYASQVPLRYPRILSLEFLATDEPSLDVHSPDVPVIPAEQEPLQHPL